MVLFIIILQIILAFLLIILVMLQGSKGNIGSAFGDSNSNAIFGIQSVNTFLSKLTFIFAVLFMLTNISLSLIPYIHSSAIDRVFFKKNTLKIQEQNISDKLIKVPLKQDEETTK